MGRVQVQQPIVAIDRDQRAVGGDATGHAGDRQFREQLQPLQGQACGRLGGRQQLWLGRLRRSRFAGQVIEEAVGRRIHIDRVVVVIQRWLVVTLHTGRAVADIVIGCRRRWEWRKHLFHLGRCWLRLYRQFHWRGNSLGYRLTDRLRRRNLGFIPGQINFFDRSSDPRSRRTLRNRYRRNNRNRRRLRFVEYHRNRGGDWHHWCSDRHCRGGFSCGLADPHCL
ncbi:hypothetical protein D3C85_1071450 [compost metagenome]